MKSKIINLMLMLLAVFMLVSCSDKKEAEEITTDFDVDTVFTVGEKKVSFAEWYLYALPIVEETETLYGQGLWNYVVNAKENITVADMIKDEIRDKITYVKVVCAKGGELGVALNEDEQMDVNFATEEYFEKLSPEIIDKYGIDEEIVKQVYSDNLLAMKVYEDLTLNIDTAIPEEQVRHMVLQYISVPKTYENEDGDLLSYSEEEIDNIRNRTQVFYEQIKETGAITELSEVESELFAPIEIVADYRDLTERLPENLPQIAFSLRQDEISGVFETADAFFILNCVNRTDEETTNAARVEIIETRQHDLFESEYKKWAQEVVIKYNYGIWDSIKIGNQ